jgi:hypothetical protein
MPRQKLPTKTANRLEGFTTADTAMDIRKGEENPAPLEKRVAGRKD